jgi:hypothetical protein
MSKDLKKVDTDLEKKETSVKTNDVSVKIDNVSTKTEKVDINPKKVVSAEAFKTKMYLGASIPNVVTKGSIHKNGLSKEIEELIVKLPIIKVLFVETSKLRQARKQLKQAGTVEQVAYKKVEEYINGL